jgi:purine-nucleoside/S-methyl-5'-thioadenosine phosphorylase / adenosine deaminase
MTLGSSPRACSRLMIDDIGVDTYSDERFYTYRRSVHRKEPDYGRHVHAIALARE